MPRALALCCALAALPATAAHAQLLSLGLRGGGGQTTMSVTGTSPGNRTTFLVGPTGTLWLSDALGIQFDALYVGKGFKADPAQGVTSSLDLSYLDVPIVAVMHVPSVARGMFQVRVQAGASVGFRVRCSVDQGTGDVTGITDCDPDNVGTFDFGLVGGVGLKVGRGRGGITLDATYGYGLLDANISKENSLSAKNRALMVSAGILFPIM